MPAFGFRLINEMRMDNSGYWKVITRPEEVITPGIFQEKCAVVCAKDREDEFKKLKQMVVDTGAELASLPEALAASVEKQGLLAFAYWYNKHTATISEGDLRAGNLRIKVSDGI